LKQEGYFQGAHLKKRVCKGLPYKRKTGCEKGRQRHDGGRCRRESDRTAGLDREGLPRTEELRKKYWQLQPMGKRPWAGRERVFHAATLWRVRGHVTNRERAINMYYTEGKTKSNGGMRCEGSSAFEESKN